MTEPFSAPTTRPDDAAAAAASPKRRAKYAAGATSVLLIVIGLVMWAMNRPGSTAFYRTTSEVKQMSAVAAAAPDYRVNGTVVAGSIARDGLTTSFVITDGKTDIAVVTGTAVPDTLRDGSEVVARGHYDGRVFSASEVLAKCPSKFKARA